MPKTSISVVIEGLSGFVYQTKPLESSISLATLKHQFCRELSLSAKECTFRREASVFNVASLQQEEFIKPGSRLHASCTFSVAFHVWNNLRTNPVILEASTVSLTCSALEDRTAPFTLMPAAFADALTLFIHLSPAESLRTCNDGHLYCINHMLKAITQSSITLETHAAEQVSQHADAAPGIPTICKTPYTAALVSLLMLMQLMRMLRYVRYGDTHVKETTRVLWLVLDATVKTLLDKAKQQANFLSVRKAADAHLTERASMILVEASFWMLCQLSGWADPKTCNETASCMNLLMHLVLQRDLQGRASCKLVDLGIVTVVTVMLTSQATASSAVRLMHALLYSGSLTSSEVHKAELDFIDKKAHYHLCKLLCPPFSPAPKKLAYKGYIEIQGYRDVFHPLWAPDTIDAQVVQMAAKLVAKLQSCQPTASTRVPTPDPKTWSSIVEAACQALVASHWHLHFSRVSQDTLKGFALVHQLRRIAQDFLLGYMHKMELDVSQVLRICSQCVICDEIAFEELNATRPLAMAIVNRLAHEPRHLALRPFLEILTKGVCHPDTLQHMRQCTGCSQCQGPEWQWRHETVDTLLYHFCLDAVHGSSRTAAGAIAGALYAAVDSGNQCQHLCCQDTTTLPPAGVCPPEKQKMASTCGAMNIAIQALDSNDAAQLTTQLNAIACLARICQQQEECLQVPLIAAKWKELQASGAVTWYTYSKEQMTFECAMASFKKAFQAPTPWSTDRCVALTRALHRCHDLQQQLFVPNDPPMFGSWKQPISLITAFLDILPYFKETTHITALRLQLLTACTLCLRPASAKADIATMAGKAFTKEYGPRMISIMHHMPPVNVPLEVEQAPPYISFGLPQATGHLWELRAFWLQNTVNMHGYDVINQSHAFFAKQAYATVKTWFTYMLRGPTQTGHLLGQEDIHQPLLNPVPYFSMFHWQGQTSEASEYECSRPDASTAAAMIYCLLRQVSGVVRLQNSLRNARTQAVSKRRLSHKIHQVDATGSHAEGNDMPITDKILLANHFLVCALTAVRDMKNGAWSSVLPSVMADWSWTEDPQEKSQMKRHLTQDCKLLQEHLQHLQAFFPLQNSGSPAMAAAQPGEVTVIEQLLAEEEQQAAKAAAKKAKRQKQKAKKQLQQHQLDEEAEEHRHQLDQQKERQQQDCKKPESDIEHQQLIGSQQQPAEHHQQQLQDQQQCEHLQGRALQATADIVQHGATGDSISTGSLDPHPFAWPATDSAATTTVSKADSVHNQSLTSPETSMRNATQAGHKLQQQQMHCAASADGNLFHTLFSCPLTQEIMMQPVIAADGHTYERAALRLWMTDSTTSPVTGRPLMHKHIADNLVIKNAVHKLRQPGSAQLTCAQQLQYCF